MKYLIIAAFLFLSSLSYAYSCFDYTIIAEPKDPREAQKLSWSRRQRVTAFAYFFNRLAGRKLTATQHRLTQIPILVDSYLYIGSIGPLITRYENMARDVEKAFLAHKKNVAAVDNLEAEYLQLKETKELTAEDRTRIKKLIEDSGLQTDARDKFVETASIKRTRSLIRELIGKLEKENRASEKVLAKDGDDYVELREHIAHIIYAKPSELLFLIDRIDNRFTAPLEAPTEKAETAAVAKLAAADVTAKKTSEIEKREDAVENTMHLINEHLKQIDAHFMKVEAKDYSSLDEFRQFLKDHGYWSRSMEQGFSQRETEEAKFLIAEILLLKSRLEDAKNMVLPALKLDRKLGLFKQDSDDYDRLIEPIQERPKAREIKLFARENRRVRSIRSTRDMFREFMGVIDSTFFHGWAVGKVPPLARAINVIGIKKTDLPRTAVLTILRGLYEEHIKDQHYPSLSILQRTIGKDPGKLADVIEALNAGTNDELLVTFARRVDMKELWHLIKTEAQKKKPTDPAGLHDRMEKAEERGKALGTLGILENSSRTRRILATLVNGATLLFLDWKFDLTGMFGPEDEEKDKDKNEELEPEPDSNEDEQDETRNSQQSEQAQSRQSQKQQ